MRVRRRTGKARIKAGARMEGNWRRRRIVSGLSCRGSHQAGDCRLRRGAGRLLGMMPWENLRPSRGQPGKSIPKLCYIWIKVLERRRATFAVFLVAVALEVLMPAAQADEVVLRDSLVLESAGR